MSPADTYATLSARFPIRAPASRAEYDVARAWADELEALVETMTPDQLRYAAELAAVLDAYDDRNWPGRGKA